MTTRRPKGQDVSNAAACDLRCGCGNLLARRTERGIEIKCRRCKRVQIIEIAEGDDVNRVPPD